MLSNCAINCELKCQQHSLKWIYCRKHACWLRTSFKSCSYQLVAFLASEPTLRCIRKVPFCTAIWFDYQTFWIDVYLRASDGCKTVIRKTSVNFLFNNYWCTPSRTYYFSLFLDEQHLLIHLRRRPALSCLLTVEAWAHPQTPKYSK